MQRWYPEYEPRMIYIQPQGKDKWKLTKYILYSRHGKITKNLDKPEWMLINEEGEWDEIRNQASSFVN